MAYQHLRPARHHSAGCVPGRPAKDCALCEFHQELSAPFLPGEVAAERRIREQLEAINRARIPA